MSLNIGYIVSANSAVVVLKLEVSILLLVQVQLRDEECTFFPEQVMATMLTYLRQVAAKALGEPVADCVVSVSVQSFPCVSVVLFDTCFVHLLQVPSFFTDAQRQAMLDSCSIAGLNCLRLMNETTAGQ